MVDLTMLQEHAYWLDNLGVLYRRRGTKHPRGGALEYWDPPTREWIPSNEWYVDVLDGDTDYVNVTEEQAKSEKPAAFRV